MAKSHSIQQYKIKTHKKLKCGAGDRGGVKVETAILEQQ